MKKLIAVGATLSVSLLLASCTIDPAIDTLPSMPGGFFVYAVDTQTQTPVNGVIVAESVTPEGTLTEYVELDTQGRAYVPVSSGEWSLQVQDVSGQLLRCDGPNKRQVVEERITNVVLACSG